MHFADRHAQLESASLIPAELPAIAKMLQYILRTLPFTHSCGVALMQISDLVTEARLRGPVTGRRLIIECFIRGADFVALGPIE